jgi:hypothetical protein
VVATLSEARLLHTATLLQDGRVLIAGGVKDAGFLGLPSLATGGELFDPTGDSFSAAGALDTTRAGHGAIRLPDGRVLLAGGINGIASAQADAELFTVGSGFAGTGSLPSAKAGVEMTLLPDGSVLETGGLSGSLIAPLGVATASIYSGGVFVPTGSLTVARGAHRTISLPDGSVLSIGGAADDMTVHDSIDRYYP